MNTPVDPQPGTDKRTLYALIGGVVLLILIVAYFATRPSDNQDKLDDSAAFDDPADPEANKACSGNAVNDGLKQALFRAAAASREGVDQVYGKIAGAAFLRIENAALENEEAGSAQCTASISIQLPPGIAASGGRRNLMANVDYTVDGEGTVSVRDDGGLAASLAGLTRSSGGVSGTLSDDDQGDLLADPVSAGNSSEPTTPVSPPPAGPAVVRGGGSPSFDCANARTAGEQAVCGDGTLAQLDRTMAAQYRSAMAAANSEQSLLLRRTRDRFLAYRDQCSDRQCIANSYNGRMREIRDIMEGRWRPR